MKFVGGIVVAVVVVDAVYDIDRMMAVFVFLQINVCNQIPVLVFSESLSRLPRFLLIKGILRQELTLAP